MTFGPDFHHFDRLKLDARAHIWAQNAAFSLSHLKVADIVLI